MKKLALVLMMILLTVTTMAGCTFVTVEPTKYYNEVVARVGTEDIDRFDLLSAYNNFGYTQYVTNGGQTAKKALESTLDFLIDRQLLINYAKEEFTLTDYEINLMCQNVFDYFDGQYEQYDAKAKKILKIDDIGSGDGKTETDNSKYIFTEYEKRATIKVVNGVETIETIKVEKTLNEADAVLDISHYTHATDFDYMAEKLYASYERKAENQTVAKKADELYLKALINGQRYILDEEGKHLSKDKEDVFLYEFKNIYEYQYENALLTKIRDDYLNNHNIDIQPVLKKYKQLVETDEVTFALDIDSYYSKMLEDSKSVYYHPNGEFFYVYNVLLPFEEDAKNTLTDYKAMVDNKVMSQAKYEEHRLNFAKDIAVKARDKNTGEQVGEKIDFKDIYTEISTAVKGGTEYQKLQEFNKFIYKYNSDEGMLNAESPYVVGLTQSNMVDEFKEEARKLDENGVYGAISNLVLTDYGYHIIFYAGKVENTFSDLRNLTLTALNGKYVTKLRNYTLFDKMFDTVYPLGDVDGYTQSAETGYSNYESELVKAVSQNYKVKIYSTVLHSSDKL